MNHIIRMLCILLAFPFASLAHQGFIFEPELPNIFGRLLIDAVWAGNEHQSNNQFGDDIDVRALRLGAKGKLCVFCHYKVEVDFAGNAVDIKDAEFSFALSDQTTLSIGQFKPFFSLEELTSSRHIPFLERGLPNVLVPDRRLGVGLHHHNRLPEDWFYTLSVGGFGESIAQDGANNANQGYYVGARGTMAHYPKEYCYAMLGMNAGYERTNTDNTLRYRARPESNLLGTRLVDTGLIEDVKDVALLSAESTAQIGRFGLQGEYIYQHTNRRQFENIDFNGFYVLASIFITPDFRPFDTEDAVMARVKPSCPWGALELTTRLSYVDLNDQDIMGGHERNVSVGLTWYLNPYLKVMGNVIKANAHRQGVQSRPLIGTLRIQGDFG